LLEGANLINAGINAWMTRQICWGTRDVYRPIEESQTLSHDGRPVAVIAEFVRGRTADIRIGAHDASEAVSMTQMFADAAVDIYSKLSQMQRLAERAANSLCSSLEKADMQQQFQQLASQVNFLAENTQYDCNNLFTTAGETVSVSLGDEQYIHLFPKDLSFSGDTLDLTTEPQIALRTIQNAAESAGEYRQYLAGQLEYLEDAMATYDRKLDTMDIDSDGFTTTIAAEITGRITEQIRENTEPILQIQANVIPERAAHLLKFT
jgi:flagellin